MQIELYPLDSFPALGYTETWDVWTFWDGGNLTVEELMVRIDGQVGRLTRRKDDLERENAVLRGEFKRLHGRLLEVSRERDVLERRIKRSARGVETALSRLALLSDDV